MHIIKKLKTRKSPGDDNINNCVVKQLPKTGIIFLAFIFKACIRLSYFPDKWKIAKIVAIPKPQKDHSKPENYRPISLLSCLSKIFERILLNRLNIHIEAKKTIPKFQFGFRPQHSTTHQLSRVTQHIKNKITSKQSTGMVLFDGEKAFDTVWHNGLIYKLIKNRVPIHLIKIIASFLKRRKFFVSIKNAKSRTHNIVAGVPQGSCLSPTLYNIFTSDIPSPPNCEMALFADDLAMFTSFESPDIIIITLQTGINIITSYFVKWRIKINGPKTQAIFFTQKRAQQHLPNRNLVVCNSNIDWENNVKYLGMQLDKKLLYITHINSILKKLDTCTHIYYPFLNRNSKLSIKNKMIMYKVVFLPIMLYGCSVWCNISDTQKKRLQIKQNKILKMINNLNYRHPTTQLHDTCKIDMITQLIEQRTHTFFASCAHSTNSLISEISPL